MQVPPIAVTPPAEPPGEGVQLVNALWRHRGAVVGTLAAFAAAVTTWYALTGRVEGVAQRQIDGSGRSDRTQAVHPDTCPWHSGTSRALGFQVGQERLSAGLKLQR